MNRSAWHSQTCGVVKYLIYIAANTTFVSVKEYVMILK